MVKRKKVAKDAATLLKELGSVSVFIRKSAIIDLAHLNASEAVPELIKLLKDKEATLRGVAAWALGEIGDKRATKPLVAALKDMDVEVRRAVSQSLFRLEDPGSLAAMKDASVDSDKWVAEWAQKAVLGLGGNEAAQRKARKTRGTDLLKLES